MKLRITPDGAVLGLWDDAIDWSSLGRVSVRRASHVEFDDRRQLWVVQSGQPQSRWRRVLQGVLRRPFGEVLHAAATRSDALAWEQTHFGPGGEGWIAESIRKLEDAKAVCVNRRQAADLAAHGQAGQS